MTLSEIRRRPTLPGRFQPSTISVLRLNFCVRDGNRWDPQAIVTGNSKLSLDAFAAAFLVSTLRQSNCLASAFLLVASRLFLFGFRNRLDAAFALHPPHPQNRTGDMIRPRSYLRNFFLLPQITGLGFSLGILWTSFRFSANLPVSSWLP